MGDLPTDVATLQSNTLALGAASGVYLSNPTTENQTGLINAIAAETANLAAVGSDLNQAIQDRPNAAAISKTVGITEFLASLAATGLDVAALRNQLSKETFIPRRSSPLLAIHFTAQARDCKKRQILG